MDVRIKKMSVGRTLSKLEFQATFVVGKLRRGSSLTRKDIFACLGRIGRTMQKYGLNSIKDIKPNHVRRYFAELQTTGMSPGRMANHATAMRLMCRMIGKPEVMPTITAALATTSTWCPTALRSRPDTSAKRIWIVRSWLTWSFSACLMMLPNGLPQS